MSRRRSRTRAERVPPVALGLSCGALGVLLGLALGRLPGPRGVGAEVFASPDGEGLRIDALEAELRALRARLREPALERSAPVVSRRTPVSREVVSRTGDVEVSAARADLQGVEEDQERLGPRPLPAALAEGRYRDDLAQLVERLDLDHRQSTALDEIMRTQREMESELVEAWAQGVDPSQIAQRKQDMHARLRRQLEGFLDEQQVALYWTSAVKRDRD